MKPKNIIMVIAAIGIIALIFSMFPGSDSKDKITGNSVNVPSSLDIRGSDTLLQMVSNLAEEYSKSSPQTRISVTGGGSGAGIAAIINKEINIADASRQIKEKELALAKEGGLEIKEFIIARDMLSVISHQDNPIDKLTVDEIGAIFRGEITNWKEVGGEDKEITLYGRQSTSGTYAFFMEEILEGDYSKYMRNMEGNQAILESVKQDSSGIGYVGIGYLYDENKNPIDDVTILKVGNDGSYISPLDKDELDKYPISRALYQYTTEFSKGTTGEYELIMFELSEEGQRIVENSGFVRINSQDMAHNQNLISLA